MNSIAAQAVFIQSLCPSNFLRKYSSSDEMFNLELERLNLASRQINHFVSTNIATNLVISLACLRTKIIEKLSRFPFLSRLF